MWQRVLLILLVICLSTVTTAPKRANAFITTIGANAIKASVRPLVASMITKQGVRTTEKAALRKAEEKWFSRMTADQVAAIEKAAQRAEPVAGKQGWLKTTIGVGMWLTGADLVFDLYDLLRNGQQVEYYTSDPIPSGSQTLMTGWNGIYMQLERISDTQAYLVFRSTVRSDWFYYEGCYGVANDSTCRKPQSLEYWAGQDSSGYQIYKPYYYHMTRVGFDATYGTWGVELYKTPYVDPNSRHSYIYPIKFRISDGIFDMNTDLKRASDNVPFGFERPATPTYVPNPHTDLFPDSQAVEVVYPDPAVYPDPEQAVIENPDVVTNPEPTTPPTGGGTTPTDPETPPSDGEFDLDWSPIIGPVTTKFPFSLPFDFFALIRFLSADPVVPEFKIPIDLTKSGLFEEVFYIEGDLTWLDPIMPPWRFFEYLLFASGLIMATRKLLGGAA